MSINNDISEKYQKLSSIDHVLKRPNMYIGSIDLQEQSLWILDGDVKIIEKTIHYVPGLYKIVDEILVNAYDAKIRDDTVTKIKIEVSEKEVTIFNDGIGIDVLIHPKEGIYVPELIFSSLRTSTSYSASQTGRLTGGLHGYGAKLTNIFSTLFKVEVGDAKNKKKFSQYYKNNLSFKSKPVITNYNGTGYTKISFVPDFKYFGINSFSDDMINLIGRRAYDLAGTLNTVKVYLNNKLITANTFLKYVSLFSDNPKMEIFCDDANLSKGRWKIIVCKSTNSTFKQISFVNGIYTSIGGTHTTYITNSITSKLKEYIETKYKSSIKNQFIKDQIWLFLSCSIEDPSFSSQVKEELVTPVSKFGSVCIPNVLTAKLFEKFDLGDAVQTYIKMGQIAEISKQEKKVRGSINIPKLYDARYAGTNKSSECSLILTEGDSAKSMAISGLSAIKDSHNIFGVFPLRGKLLNVREATHAQLVNNEEFKNLKMIMGLQTNKIYTKENLGELRYGSIIIMSDQDLDGYHIRGLLINMIHFYWPSLLQIKGFIKQFITPIVKIKKGDTTISFYNLQEYDIWKNSIEIQQGWIAKYYKGLGTSTGIEARDYFKNLKQNLISFEWISGSDQAIMLAFEKSKADDRKNWLKDYVGTDVIDYVKSGHKITYKDFINKELIHYSNYDNIRSIPSMIDGLKPSQRKVLFAAFKKNLVEDIKVSQFVGFISEISSYHHGEASLIETVIGMARDFVGSNNINLLIPSGQFGTRLEGGKDHASARYIFTRLNKLTRLIFNVHDDELLTYLEDDGLSIEPEFYVPIIPLILVNGCYGIGTGFSTFVPNYNPLDIIDYLLKKLANESKQKNMIPWYKGFKGTINKTNEKNMYSVSGSYNMNNNTLIITELPIYTWTEPYKIFLDKLKEQNIGITKIVNASTDLSINFTVKLVKVTNDKSISTINIEKLFALNKSIGLSNMHLHDKNGNINKYNNVEQIINEFYKIRLEFYQKRKDYLAAKYKYELDIISEKIRFITMIINNKVNIYGKTKKDVETILKKNKFIQIENSYNYLLKMPFYSVTKEKIDELQKEFTQKEVLYKNLINKTINQLWIDDLNILKKELSSL